MPGLPYFLPRALVPALKYRPKGKLRTKADVATYDGFNIPGVLVFGALEDHIQFLEAARLKDRLDPQHMTVRIKNRQSLCARDAIRTDKKGLCVRLGTFPFAGHHSELSEKDTERLKGVREEMKKVLYKLSDYTGNEFTLSLHWGGYGFVTPRDEERPITIVVGASAPGELLEYNRSTICGIRLDSDGNTKEFPYGPSRGQGVLVRTEKDEVVGQIVGNTIFVFAPFGTRYEYLLSDDGAGLFREMLRYCWNAYVANPPVAVPLPFANDNDYPELIGAWLDRYPDSIRELIRQYEFEASEYQKLYMDKLRHIRILSSGLPNAEMLRATEIPDQRKMELERIKNHPLVESVGLLEDGIQIATRVIIQEFEDKKYRLGTYYIRIPRAGDVAVWAIKSYHMHGDVQHPHIGFSGRPCFGNLTAAIGEACAEHRIADTVELVLRWLAEGYDSTLATNKIDEWPEEGFQDAA